MLDIILEDIDDSLYNVNFVHMGCTYECPKENIDSFCSNIVRLYHECSILYDKDFKYLYLPFETVNKLYSSRRELVTVKEITISSRKVEYKIEKVC